MIVRNINSDSLEAPLPKEHKNWLQYWERMSKKKAKVCSSTCCPEEAVSGVLVYPVALLSRKKVYVIPLCRLCSSMTNKRNISVKRSIAITVKDVHISKAKCISN